MRPACACDRSLRSERISCMTFDCASISDASELVRESMRTATVAMMPTISVTMTLIVEKLARKRVGYDVSRWGQPEPYPSYSVAGPMVALTNQWAGSDGDIFCHVFKLMKLGPLIGTRTWGGVIGISPRHALADGSVTTQPEYSFWFVDVGWGVENYGTDPDIEVDVAPQDYATGRDPQLDRAIAEVLRLLEERPPAVPAFGERPVLTPPARLP